MKDNRYVLIFTFILTATVAILLTGLREVTKEGAVRNEEIFNKRAILSAIESKLGEGVTVKSLSDQEVMDIFQNSIEQVALNMEGEEVAGVQADKIDMAKERKKPEAERLLPFYTYNGKDGKSYILSVRGNGLWDEIWGNIALESDLNTIAGAAFDHKGETPGLGAEIKDNPSFPRRFKGKKIYADDGELVGIDVKKGGAKPGNEHAVDGISGATVTANGVAEMLDRGLKYYDPYLKQLKQTSMLETK